MIKRSSRYGEYVRRGRRYDGSGVPISSYLSLYPSLPSFTNVLLVSRIIDESKRLDRKERNTKELFRAKRSALLEA
jgi:hypothetical protein